MEEKKIQQKLILYQLLHKHMETLQERFKLLENTMVENATTRQVIGDLKEKTEMDLLIPLGSGYFVSGKSMKGGKLLANIGAGVFAEKETPDAEKLLDERKNEIEGVQEQLQEELKRTAAQLNAIGAELKHTMEHKK